MERDNRRKLLCNAAIQAYQPIKAARDAQKEYDEASILAANAPEDRGKQQDATNKKQIADNAKAAITSAQQKAYVLATAAVKMHDARRAAMVVGNNAGNLDRVNKASDRLEEALAITRSFTEECPDPLGNLTTAVGKLPPGHTREALFVLINQTKRDLDLSKATAGDQINKLHDNLSAWYNNAMDRVGGWYKRWTQKVLLGLALVIVCSINADTIMLIQQLTKQDALRSSLVAAAQEASRSTPKANETPEAYKFVLDKAEKLKLPLGWSATPKDVNAFPCQDFQFPKSKDSQSTQDQNAKFINELFIEAWGCRYRLIFKLIGLFLTIFALSLGAPFWFDILSKFVNIRSAGTPPGETKKGTPAPTNETTTKS